MGHRSAAQPGLGVWRWLLLAAACVLTLAAARALLASPPPRRAHHPAPHALVRERTSQMPSVPRRPARHPLQIERVRLVDVFHLPKLAAIVARPAATASVLPPPLPSSDTLVLLPLALAPAVLGLRLGRPRAPPPPG